MPRVTIERDGCISCAACWGDCPEVFEENDDDGLSQVKAEYRAGGDPATGQVPDDLEDCAKGAAEACPVEVIHVE
ncbi:MAG: ferredoxin [Anaerolineae bacterium]